MLALVGRICKRSLSSSVTPSKRIRICVVGAGPAGFYATQLLVKNLPDAYVDIIEKFPVPFGLVRYGVAPDHPEVKNVINTFTKTAQHERVRFLGNLCLGKDFTIAEIREHYHAVLLTYGSNEDKTFGLANENDPKIISARDFVAWYNGLPGSTNLRPDLSGSSAIIIGNGNVAIDVARIILSPIDLLKTTDITENALETLSTSSIRNVSMVARRGPLNAAFTIKELREMLKLKECSTQWRRDDFLDIPAKLSTLERPRKRITELMLSQLSLEQKHEDQKQFLPIFYRAPTEFQPQNSSVTIQFRVNDTRQVVDGIESETIQSDLVFRSIGYKSEDLDANLNFDKSNGLIRNTEGRVLCKGTTKSFENGLYTGGWLATGPRGSLINTMNAAYSVAQLISQDIKDGSVDVALPKDGLNITGKRVVTWSGWQRIDRTEVSRGKIKNKPREKIVDIEEMLRVAGV